MLQLLFHYNNIAMGCVHGQSILYIHDVFEISVFYIIMFVYDGNRACVRSYIYIYIYITSGECSLGQTIPM